MRIDLSFAVGTLLFASATLPAHAQPVGEHKSAGKEVEQQAEGDWADARWNQTDVGPFLASTMHMPGGDVAKALSIRVGENSDASVCYDTSKPFFRAAWTGGFLKFDGRRFGLLKAPIPASQWTFTTSSAVGWLGAESRHEALHLNGKRVVLDTRVGETLVKESPWFENIAGLSMFTRSFEVAPGSSPLTQKVFFNPKEKSE